MTTDFLKNIEQFKELQKNVASYAARLNAVVGNGLSPVIKEQADLAVSSLDTATRYSEQLTQVESPQELMEAQQALAKELGENFQTSAQNLLGLQAEMGEEFKSLLQEGMEAFTPEHLREFLKED